MASQFRVLITDRAWSDSQLEREILQEIGAEIVEAPDGDESTLLSLARDVDAIATCWAQVTPGVIEASPKLRIVCRMGIGLDNIAVDVATRRGIPVTNMPDYCVEEVSDHAIALMMALIRKIGFYHSRVKRGEYNLQAGPALRRLSTLTLGVIGLGRIGSLVASNARDLGMQVIAYSRNSRSGEPYECVSLDELLTRSDVISLHVPLTDETKEIIDRRALTLMKPTAYLINTSRGALIDQQALMEALNENRLAGAGLDVFSPEPPDLSEPLFRDERVIVTPHAAFLSDESLIDLRTCVAHQIKDALIGKTPLHVVNPEIYRTR